MSSESPGLRLSPAQFTMISFVVVSLVGMVLLMLPLANTNGQWLDWVSAFFMSVSATCVTGLAVVDVGQDFTIFGQAVILFLMQVGGLSYMTITTILLYMVGKKLSIGDSKIFDLSNNSDKKINFADFVFRIAMFTFAIEGIGLLCMLKDSYHTYVALHYPSLSSFSWEVFFEALFQAAFHAVSAFCNAGLSLYSDSICGFRENHWILFMFSILPIIGGLGYTVLHELSNWAGFKRKKRKTLRKINDEKGERFIFSLHTRVSLIVTFTLLAVGIITQLVLIYAQDLPTLNDSGFVDKFWVATFQSIASRSSGFNSIPLPELGEPSHIFLIVWMIIGACPGGTGGGIKVTTTIVIFAIMWSGLKAGKDVKLFNRSVSQLDRRRAVIVVFSTISFIVFFTWLVNIWEAGKSMTYLDQLFEVTSAFTTVGLSTGITGDLGVASQLVLCISMLIGRPGPLLFLMALVSEDKNKPGKYPEEAILIG